MNTMQQVKEIVNMIVNIKFQVFMNRNLSKPFHLDYVFTSNDKVKNLQIPNPEYGMTLTDYLPIIFEI